MTDSRPPRFHWPVALSTFAGLLGAGFLDAVLVLLRGDGARFFETLALAAGLYGAAGLLGAGLLGWATATVLGAIPGGWRGLRGDEALDARVGAFCWAPPWAAPCSRSERVSATSCSWPA